MFTGLIEALGTVRQVADDGNGGKVLNVAEPAIAPQLVLGESVAVNGCCLTVVERDAETFRFQAGPETLARTNLGLLRPGDRVNLERALRAGDRIGGHFVLGHVDAVGTIAGRSVQGEWEMVSFACPRDLSELLVDKGSVAVDGVSLTVVMPDSDRFGVMLIPHTLANTTLGFKEVGAAVNLEADILAKHVRRLMQNMQITI